MALTIHITTILVTLYTAIPSYNYHIKHLHLQFEPDLSHYTQTYTPLYYCPIRIDWHHLAPNFLHNI